MDQKHERHARPNALDLERGAYYAFQIDIKLDAPGVIVAKPGVICWRYETRPKRSAYSPINLFRKPEFVITNIEGQELLSIRRCTRLPPCFEMIENGQVVGKIALRSILRNKYTLQFHAGPVWTFRMPLFTLNFRGESTEGTYVWARVGPQKTQWNLLVESGADSLHLLSGLAFIHREWWCYS